jgi:hypothetical protein
MHHTLIAARTKNCIQATPFLMLRNEQTFPVVQGNGRQEQHISSKKRKGTTMHIEKAQARLSP